MTSFVTLFCVAACFPMPLDETGLRCSTNSPCGPSFACIQDRCVRTETNTGEGPGLGTSNNGSSDGGIQPPGTFKNLFANGDFEVGDPPMGWTAFNSMFETEWNSVFRGTRAGRVEGMNANPTLAPYPQPIGSMAATGAYCFRGQIRGNVQLTVVFNTPAGAWRTDHSLSSDTWTTVNAKLETIPNVPATIDLRATGRDDVNDFFIADALTLWHSPNGDCN
jgi:hypothetical protein